MQYIKLLLLLFPLLGYTQEIFEYEKEIPATENYNLQEINFLTGTEKFMLSGSFMAPKNNYDKIVIIVPGSGKDTRHSHYILAENLLKNGIAVFRFDERGIGKSEGAYSELATDLAKDLSAAFSILKSKYPKKQIGIIGHSLGGIAALETIKAGFKPSFMVLLETPVIKNGTFISNQIKMNYNNSIPEIMRKKKTKDEVTSFLDYYFNYLATDTTRTRKEIKKFIKEKGFDSKFIVLTDDKFLMEMLHTNLEQTIQNINIPTLYLTGTKDKVINHKEETALLQSYNNKAITIEIFEGLNHWLTTKNAPVGTSLYLMDPQPLARIPEWILSQ